MSVLADLLGQVFDRRHKRAEAAARRGRSIETLCDELLGRSGEVSGSAIAELILDAYAALDAPSRRAFFRHLARDRGIDPGAVRHTLARFEDHPGKATYRDFMAASEPQRQELARRLNRVPGGTQRLVQMRADLLDAGREDPDLAPVDLDLRHLFASWFNRGFLVLQGVNWDSPASVLEKIIAYEAVHAIDTWDDLRRRLQPADRRCFGFFHPAMPGEPLIFVEVALTQGIPTSIQRVLAEDRAPLDAHEADTAVFYSISNCQAGLAGISFGNSLIKQVVAQLSQDLPGLRSFVTLSPIPGLRDWAEDQGFGLPQDATALQRRAAQYLCDARRPDGRPFDPVARFHLGNGARMEAVHALADTSQNGERQSGGAMVTYLYDLSEITHNHEGFAERGEIAASPAVLSLARAARQSASSETV